jgi:5'-methylthioadenosine phosphorylase
VAEAEIGIIGGSGLYAMPGLMKAKEVRVKTPFGAPSDAYVCGTRGARWRFWRGTAADTAFCRAS